jgi:hypothetical protein
MTMKSMNSNAEVKCALHTCGITKKKSESIQEVTPIEGVFVVGWGSLLLLFVEDGLYGYQHVFHEGECYSCCLVTLVGFWVEVGASGV